MIEIARILCPVDFSDFSRRALDYASALARWYEARLTVLSVFPNVVVMDLPPMPMQAEDRRRIEDDLKRFTAHLPPGLSIDFRIEDASDVHRRILEVAAAIRADLLVIGSHGRSGFERLLLGSVAERVIREAPCPTMIVPPRAPDAPPDSPVQVHSIVCPVDFSEGAKRALEYAITMAEEADARLTVLHVIEIPPEFGENRRSPGFNPDAIRAAAEADCLRRLRALIPEAARTFCTVETAVVEGTAHREILSVAARRASDLIVMGVQGRGAVDLMMFGSTTARVMRAASCPVLVVPTAAAQSSR